MGKDNAKTAVKVASFRLSFRLQQEYKCLIDTDLTSITNGSAELK